MPQQCRICFSPDRQLIEAAHQAGRSLRDVAGAYSVTKDSLYRHLRAHVPAAVGAEQEGEPRQNLSPASPQKKGTDVFEEIQYQDFIARWRHVMMVPTRDLRDAFACAGQAPERLTELLAEAVRRVDLSDWLGNH